MNKLKPIYFSILLCIQLFKANGIASQEHTNSFEHLAESILLVNDREVYCAGEIILFTAFNISDERIKLLELSKVLYVEIITPDGQAFEQEKFRFSEDFSSGQIRIPESVQTGGYYIKAYTKWMRNFSPYSYFYKPIRVINPHSDELLQSSLISSEKVMLAIDSLLMSSQLEIRTRKESYSKRKNISVELLSEFGSAVNISISICKEGLITPTQILNSNPGQPEYFGEYSPETRGLSISGRIIHASDSGSVAFNPVQLTLFSDNHLMLGTTADKSGRFNIALPDLEGRFELFISTNLTKDKQDPIILIDNDFCTKKINLPFIPFSIEESEKELLNEMCLNQQMMQMYHLKKDTVLTKQKSPPQIFYGNADYTVKLADYIELPTLQDYIHELMPNITIRQKNKSKYVKVLGIYSDLKVYDPLLLLDMVPVKDVNRILAISPKNIERVEVVGVPYIRGNQLYGGIVSFFSKEGDLAGIDLPDWGNFIKLKFYSDQKPPNINPPASKRTPDLRNTLYWNPSLSIEPGESKEFSFTTGDLAGDYLILIKGTDADGNTVTKSSKFRIK